MQTYLLVINGKPEGPFTLAELKARPIKPDDFVKTDAMDDYKQAHEVAELREILGFKKQVLLQYFGSFDQRLLASAIDGFMVSGVCIVAVLIASVFITNTIFRLSVLLGLLVIIPLVNLVYHIIMESSAKQGTYGKQLLAIKVCDMEGLPLTRAHATGRNLAKIISVLTLFTGYLYSFFNPQKQCLHDVIAGTLVVKDRL
ncbi:MAG: RDD family protein [Mucilaginibacter sp.]